MYCLIHNEKVIQIEDDKYMVHPDLIWIETDDETIEVGWDYIEQSFYPPVIPEPITPEEG